MIYRGDLRTGLRLVGSPALFSTALRAQVPGPRLTRYWPLIRAVRRRRPRCIIEIGLYRGERSQLLIDEARRRVATLEYWGFDLFAQGMTAELMATEASLPPLSIEDVRSRLARPALDLHLVAGPSATTLAKVTGIQADLVFIDGGHSYDTVATDWANAQRLLAPGGIVFFDDYTNEDPVVHEGFGVTRLVDGIDRDRWRVKLLHPVDTTERAYGRFQSRLVALTARRQSTHEPAVARHRRRGRGPWTPGGP